MVRLDGNNAAEGRRILDGRRLAVVEQVATMDDAARRAAELAAAGPDREHEMAIFLTGDSRVMIQGITGSEGTKHGRRMLAAGTTVVGGTNPRKAGQTVDLGGSAVPVFGTVAETMAATGRTSRWSSSRPRAPRPR